MTTERISLGAVWQETAAFMRAEAALVAPVALAAFGLPVILLQLLIPEKLSPETAAGPWMWALIPYALCSMTGTLAISALALRSGISVAESLMLALRRLPVAIAVALIALGALIAAMLLVSVAGGIERGTLGRSGPVFAVALFALIAAMISALVRALPVWTLIAQGEDGPVVTLRAALRLTRGRYLRLLLLRAVAWVSQVVILLVIWVPLADILNLLGRAAKSASLGELLALVAGGLVMSAIIATWTVYVARLSRTLASSSGI